MRLPNGYGSVFKLSGNRRRPFCARVTTGWTDDGKQIYHTIGYYARRSEAMAALAEYHKNPIGPRGEITLEGLYEEWSRSKYGKISASTEQSYRAAWNHLSVLKHMRFKDIRKSHIQAIIDSLAAAGKSYSSCHKVKVLAGLLYKEALADDIVNKNYAALVELPEDGTRKKDTFTDAEIKKIADAAPTDQWANTILILIYTGMRIGELLTLTKFSIDLQNMIITGGIKTDAGKDRVIPVHPKIQEYIRQWYALPGSYLIQRNGQKIRTEYYRKSLFYPTLETLGIRKLNPHCTRHTFASLLNRVNANTKSIQELIGHADYATTANIYTHTDLDELRKAIESI